jgi:hypothetical protein
VIWVLFIVVLAVVALVVFAAVRNRPANPLPDEAQRRRHRRR